MPIDRLSELPDPLLHLVLSRLELKEAAITSLLSKRWRYLWADLPRFDFLETSIENEQISKFMSLVRKALVYRTLNYLEFFCVKFIYDELFASDVDFCLESVANYKTKHVRLLFFSDEHFYELPQVMCSNSSLVTLYLRRCVMVNTIDWPSLESLIIADSVLPQNAIDQLFSNCPVLHTLTLPGCRGGFSRLDIKSRKLDSLEINETSEARNSSPLLEISAPYLKWLSIYNWHPEGRKLHLKNISSLDYANLEFYLNLNEDFISVELMTAVRELLEQVRHVHYLNLGWNVVKIVSRMVVSGRQLPLSSVKTLYLSVLTSGGDPAQGFSGVVGLLESSPKLEHLTLSSDSSPLEEDITWAAAARDDRVRDLRNLKNVLIVEHGLRGTGPLLTVAQILLKRAIVLEKLEIVLFDGSPAYIAETNQKLHSYPRSSQKAQVLCSSWHPEAELLR